MAEDNGRGFLYERDSAESNYSTSSYSRSESSHKIKNSSPEAPDSRYGREDRYAGDDRPRYRAASVEPEHAERPNRDNPQLRPTTSRHREYEASHRPDGRRATRTVYRRVYLGKDGERVAEVRTVYEDPAEPVYPIQQEDDRVPS